MLVLADRRQYLMSCVSTAGLCVFSQLHEFALIRKIEDRQAEAAPDGVPSLVFASEGSRAVRYASARKLCALRVPDFALEAELFPFSSASKSVSIAAFAFSSNSDGLFVCGSDSRMRLFTLRKEVRGSCAYMTFAATNSKLRCFF